jgi:hypothetical protein
MEICGTGRVDIIGTETVTICQVYVCVFLRNFGRAFQFFISHSILFVLLVLQLHQLYMAVQSRRHRWLSLNSVAVK